MSQSPATAQAPILKGSWSDAEKLALLLSIIKSTGPPKWSNGLAVPRGRTLQASAKMYSELLKASASVKMTTGDAVTPSGKRPRLGAFNDKGLDEVGKGGPSQKKRKTAVAQPKKTKTKATGKRPSVVGDYSGEVEEEDDGDDESFGEGEQDEEKITVKKEVKGDDEEGIGGFTQDNEDAV